MTQPGNKKLHQNPISEILILDSGSTDDTKSVAEAFGAKFHTQTWLGFGRQKKEASRLARNDWILNLDADERPDSDFMDALRQFAESVPLNCWAAKVTRDTIFLGKKIRFGGASRQHRIRLFHKQNFDWNDKLVHEDVVPIATQAQSVVARLKGTIHHHTWKSIASWLDSTNTRTSALAANSDTLKLRFLKVKIVSRFFFEFIRSYFLRLGFLDGIEGFIFCILMAFSHEIKLIKYYESAILKISNRTT